MIKFLIIFIAILIFINYYYGKIYFKCIKCEPNKYYFINYNLPNNYFIQLLKKQFDNNGIKLNPDKNFNNTQGKKLNYNQLPKKLIDFYLNDNLKNLVSKAVGEKVNYAPKNEKYRIFSRIYDSENDFIDWHYDNNFTKGNRYTLVIPILVTYNNSSNFMIKDKKTSDEKIIDIPLGKGITYNGSITYHKITHQTKNNIRMVIIIPFYSDYKMSLFGYFRKNVRDITNKLLTL